jgi:hypothetical protein
VIQRAHAVAKGLSGEKYDHWIPLNKGVIANITRIFFFLSFFDFLIFERQRPLSDHAYHLYSNSETLMLGNVVEVSCGDCVCRVLILRAAIRNLSMAFQGYRSGFF